MRVLAALLLALALTLPAQASTIARIDIPAPAMAAPVAAEIYVPDGAAPAGGWPVLYLLHGLGGDETSWTFLGHLQPTLDALIAAGKVAPMLVVMPAMGNNWYVNTRPVGGADDTETALIEQLPAYIEANYPVRKDAGGRAIGGLSMGGYGALRLGFGHPERFSSIVSLSPALWENVPQEDLDLPPDQIKLLIDSAYFHRADPDTMTIGVDLPPAGTHFGAAFGDPFEPRRFNAANAFTLLETLTANNQAVPPLYLSVGDDDSHLLWRGAIALYETMKANSQPLEFRITDGDHSWSVWAASIGDGLSFVDAHWGKAP